MVKLTYHEPSNKVSCQCREIINGEHECKADDHNKVTIVYCDEKTCKICKDKRAKQEYHEMWTMDRDDYVHVFLR